MPGAKLPRFARERHHGIRFKTGRLRVKALKLCDLFILVVQREERPWAKGGCEVVPLTVVLKK